MTMGREVAPLELAREKDGGWRIPGRGAGRAMDGARRKKGAERAREPARRRCTLKEEREPSIKRRAGASGASVGNEDVSISRQIEPHALRSPHFYYSSRAVRTRPSVLDRERCHSSKP
ncbi:hypothetical protein KM043_008182 [Ampulex compressa]|nr:hypothetical protein KM043_008182 [Ampulex compressa]